MKWISMFKKRSNTDVSNRESKEKTVKQIQKEIGQLRDQYQKIEFRPCHGDVDLIQKDKDLGLLKGRIYELEKERDTYLYSWSH
jgi:hypothetical protein